jgi:SAM-dependent methyltransferase
MYIATYHGDLVVMSEDESSLTQSRSFPPPQGLRPVEISETEIARLEAEQPVAGERGVTIADGLFSGYEYIKASRPHLFHLFKGGYLCAPPNSGAILCDRQEASDWEMFSFLSPEATAERARFDTHQEEVFQECARALTDRHAPLRLHCGCGPRLINGFLNIDKFRFFGPFGDHEDYLIYNFSEKPWPLPDASVDYIYSEDFIEHIPQKWQVAFLAEAYRVLKPGCYHRINTPCLADSMRTHSDFSKGMVGVYFGEFDEWLHVALLTRGLIGDLARAIGYRQVFFTAKSCGSSPYAVEDLRPLDDRDDVSGNIFADLLK